MIVIVAALVRAANRRWRADPRKDLPDRRKRRTSGVRPTMHGRRRDRLDRFIVASAWSCLALAIACIIGWITDDRTIDGHSVWAKPTKFALSIGLAGAATVWLRRRLAPTRTVRAATLAFTAAMAFEQVLITTQAARGVRSHFNVETRLDGLVFQVMGFLISIAFVSLVMLALAAMRRPPSDRIVATVARYGLWLVTAASVVGIVMSLHGGHAIAGPDNGPGMPLTGWSTVNGDLRPAHFVGLHGLQLLIALAAIAGGFHWPAERTNAALRGLSATIAAALVGLTAQALAGQPVTSVSSLAVATAAAGVGLAIATRATRQVDRRGALSAVQVRA